MFVVVDKLCLTICNPKGCSTGFTISWSLLKFMSIESVMLPNHLIFCCPFLFVFSLSQHHSIFQWVSSSLSWPQYWSFSLSISPSNEYSGLISFRINWFYILAVRGPLKSLQHHSSKASILWCLAFLVVQLSHLYMTTGKTIALIKQNFVSKVIYFLICCLEHRNMYII